MHSGFRRFQAACAMGPPQHFLYLRPERQGHGAFLGIFVLTAGAVGVDLQNGFTRFSSDSGVLQNEIMSGDNWLSGKASGGNMARSIMAAKAAASCSGSGAAILSTTSLILNDLMT